MRHAFAAICLVWAWPLAAAWAECPIQLRDVTGDTGIAFVHTDGSSGRRYIVETVCCGLALLDYDGDGDEDIYFLNGAPLEGAAPKVAPTNALYRNDGGWQFTDVTKQAGAGDTGYGLGVCAGDYDNDGDLDVVVLNARQRPTILRNDSPQANHWLQVRLHDTKTNRNGIGARVTVVAGDLTQVDEVHSGRSYQSDYGKRLCFGLGAREQVDRIEVRWIGGGINVVRNIHADQLVTITEEMR